MPKKTLEVVLSTGNHLLVQVKGNQPSLLARALQITALPPVHTSHSHETGGHNRLERRTLSIWALPSAFGSEPWHGSFRTLIEVQRNTERFNTRTGHWHPTAEASLYLCDLPPEAAAGLPCAIRRHWHIENRLHWVRDVTLGEDRSRIRNNPGIFALLRSFALNILRFNAEDNISSALYSNALNFDKVLAYRGI